MKGVNFGAIFVGVIIGFLITWVRAWSYISFIGASQLDDFEASKFCISKNQNLVWFKGGNYYCDNGAIFVPKDND